MRLRVVKNITLFILTTIIFVPAITQANDLAIYTPDIQGVRDDIEIYLQGVRTGNVTTMAQAFSPDARIHGYYDGDSFNGPIQLLFDDLSNSCASKDLKAHISNIEIQDPSPQ